MAKFGLSETLARSAWPSRSIQDGLKAIERRLAVCAECCEEYEALRRALEALDDGQDNFRS